MLAIIKKEIRSFFSSPIGYLVIGLFLVINGLFLWVFTGEFNILDTGFAELNPFFSLAPWIFLFLIPAITMRSFSEEKRLGTLELLVTKPLSILQIILGKYSGALVLILLALLPTAVYIFTIASLGNPKVDFDAGVMIGGYLGLFFLAMSYTAIGVFASSLTQNQIVAFIIAFIILFVLFYGFEAISETFNLQTIAFFGMKTHTDTIGLGILDTRDIIYFLSVTALFIGFTVIQLKKEK